MRVRQRSTASGDGTHFVDREAKVSKGKQEHTERIAIRVNKKLLGQLEQLAKKDNDRPLSTYVRIVLERHAQRAVA